MSDVVKTKMSGFEGTLNAQQQDALAELKRLLEASEFAEDVRNHPDGDQWVLRFLRATMKDKHGDRVFDAQAAEARMKRTLKWRRDNGADDIMRSLMEGTPKAPEGYYDICKASIPFEVLVNPADGTIFRYDRFGAGASQVDESALTLEQWSRCVAFTMESMLHTMREQSKIHGREISTYFTLVDVSGISLSGIVARRKFVQFMSDIGAEHYPETLGKTWLCNSPWYFSKIWAMVKPFIDKDTQMKLIVHSSVPVEDVLKYLPKALLLKEFGGENESVTLPHVKT